MRNYNFRRLSQEYYLKTWIGQKQVKRKRKQHCDYLKFPSLNEDCLWLFFFNSLPLCLLTAVHISHIEWFCCIHLLPWGHSKIKFAGNFLFFRLPVTSYPHLFIPKLLYCGCFLVSSHPHILNMHFILITFSRISYSVFNFFFFLSHVNCLKENILHE